MIQIGLPCSPDWLCQLIGWILFVVAVIGIVAIIRVNLSSKKKNKK